MNHPKVAESRGGVRAPQFPPKYGEARLSQGSAMSLDGHHPTPAVPAFCSVNHFHHQRAAVCATGGGSPLRLARIASGLPGPISRASVIGRSTHSTAPDIGWRSPSQRR